MNRDAQLKVLRPVVVLDAILMVHRFARTQRPAEHGFHNDSVLPNLLPIDPHVEVGTVVKDSRLTHEWIGCSALPPTLVVGDAQPPCVLGAVTSIN